jgi:3-oxoacyl-[acyl-carrier protein] reductase
MRNAIVTGASRGLGLAIACRLAESGYRVAAIARNRTDELQFAMDRVGDATAGRGSIVFRSFDLSELSALPDLARSLHKELGGFHCLVNNAGLGTTGTLATMPDHRVEQLIRLNVSSPILFTKYVVRAMMVSGGSRIVNIASIVASTGYTGMSVYSATKASLVGFTRSLARELGPLGITVNAVAPGFIATEMTKEMSSAQRDRVARRSALGRLAQIQDIADAVDFLVGDHAANITGTVITVDAGGTA